MTKLVFIKKENKKAFLNILGGPITFYQKGGHILQKKKKTYGHPNIKPSVVAAFYLWFVVEVAEVATHSFVEHFGQWEAAANIFKKTYDCQVSKLVVATVVSHSQFDEGARPHLHMNK